MYLHIRIPVEEEEARVSLLYRVAAVDAGAVTQSRSFVRFALLEMHDEISGDF